MVVFAAYSGAFGGAERLLLDFAGTLEGEVAIACPEGPLADAARASGLRVLPLRARSLAVRGGARARVLAAAGLVGHAGELRRLVWRLEPGLVVAWGMRSAIACLALRRRRPAIAFQHNDMLPGPWIGGLVRLAARRADRVTVPSRAVAADLDPRGRLGRQLRIVYPGVDARRFAADTPPASPPEVLVLGALSEWKRPDLALEAFALARRRFPDLRLRLLGGALDEHGDRLIGRLRERARAPDLAGAVELAGAVPDPAADLSRATCLLHCAPREPFGIAVLEALAAGRPAVVPAAAGPAEIVDESCGLLYPPDDAGAAAEAIVQLLAEPDRAARLGAAGRARALRRFDRREAQNAYGAVLAPLLPASRRTRADRARAPGLALLTVTHNSAASLRALLSSAARHLPGVRVIVVDSGSTDDTLEVSRGSESVFTIPLAENVGFGRACNRGMVEIHEPVTVLVNPDVELVDDSLFALAAELRSDGAGERLLAPLVLEPDGSPQDTVHPVPGSPADLVRAVVPPALIPGGAAAPWRARCPRRVGWAVGCALAGRTDTLRRLGPFDERIFLFGEDLDLGLRAASAGIETWFWPSARVVHHRAHSTAAAFGGEPFERLARARREVVAGRLGHRRAQIDDASQAITFLSRIAAKAALRRPNGRERRQLRALLRARQSDPGADGRP